MNQRTHPDQVVVLVLVTGGPAMPLIFRSVSCLVVLMTWSYSTLLLRRTKIRHLKPSFRDLQILQLSLKTVHMNLTVNHPPLPRPVTEGIFTNFIQPPLLLLADKYHKKELLDNILRHHLAYLLIIENQIVYHLTTVLLLKEHQLKSHSLQTVCY